MPTKRRRRNPRFKPELVDPKAAAWMIVWGRPALGSCPITGRLFRKGVQPIPTDEELANFRSVYELWKAAGNLDKYIREHALQRPFAWLLFDAPERRRVTEPCKRDASEYLWGILHHSDRHFEPMSEYLARTGELHESEVQLCQ